MHQTPNLSGWRKAALVVGSLALIAAGGAAVATQAFADTGHSTAKASTSSVVKAAPKSTAATTSKPAAKKDGCSDLRSDLRFSDVPEAATALGDAVASVGSGSVSDTHGERSSATCHHPEAVTAYLSYAPEQGAPAGQVAVSFMQDEEFAYAGGAAAYVSTCDFDGLEDCHLSTLPDGSTLRTYAIRQDLAGGTWEILVADRLVGDQVISVQSQGPRANDADGTVLGDAVLSTEQISGIAEQLDFIS